MYPLDSNNENLTIKTEEKRNCGVNATAVLVLHCFVRHGIFPT